MSKRLAGRTSGFFLYEFAAAAAKEFLDEVGGVDAPAELGVVQHGFLERDGGFDSLDDVLACLLYTSPSPRD